MGDCLNGSLMIKSIADLDVGPMEDGATVQHHFIGTVPVAAGRHTIQLRVTRPFSERCRQAGTGSVLDDVVVELLSEP